MAIEEELKLNKGESEDDTSNNQMTEWDNEPTIIDLKQDITDASSDVSAHVSKVDKWLENLNITGQAVVTNGKGRSNIVPKLIRKQAEWRYASLSEPFLATSDIFDVDPITYEDKKAAEQNALVLNNQFNTKIDKTKFVDEYVRTAVDEGTVIVRVGWDFEEEEVEVEVPDYDFEVTQDPAEVQQVEQALQDSQENPQAHEGLAPEVQQAMQLSAQQGQPIIPVQIGSHTETQIKTIRNHPTLEVCNYKNISIDPTAIGDLSKASFLSYTFDSSKAELKRDGKYKNLDDIIVDDNSVLAAPDTDTDTSGGASFTFNDEPRKRLTVVEYWGFWDIHDDGTVAPIVAAWVGKTLIRLEENPYPDQKIPFVIAQYLPVRRSLYGEPDGELLEDNQRIVGAVTRGMIDTMGRSANGQQGIRKDALDITNKRKFDKGLDYEFNGSVDPRVAFHMHTYPEVPQSAQFMLGLQNNEAESLTGVKAFSSTGITGAALGENVGGIKSAMDAASKRELGILRRLATGIKEIGRKIISMNGEFLDEEEIVRVTNDEFVPVKRDDLAGNFDLRLSISTPEADESKAKELAFMLQTTGQTMGPEFSKIILSDIAKLRKMPDLAKRISDYAPQPDPQAQEKAMLEIELLKAQIATEMSKANENNAEAELDKAKIGNLQSDTDLKDLDFLEQESGTKQAQQMQLQSEKAKKDLQGNLIQQSEKNQFDREENRFAANSSANSL